MKARWPGGGAQSGSFPHLVLVARRKCIPRLDTPLRTKPYRLGTHGSGYLANCFSRTTILLLSVYPISEELLTLSWQDSCPGGRST